MEDRRPDAEQARTDEQDLVAVSDGEYGQPGEREERAARQSKRRRTAIRVQANEWLQQRRRDLISEGHQANLNERESELNLEIRIDRRQQRLQHVIEQMTEADRDEDGEDGVVARGGVGRHERVGDDPMFVGM